MDSCQHQGLTNSGGTRNPNAFVIKFSWPEETRVSEVTFNGAEWIGNTDDPPKSQIPTMLGNMYLTSLIRQFLGRAIASHRSEIKYPDNEHIRNTFSDCFFCKCFHGPYAITSINSSAGHWHPREHPKHGDTDVGNLMYNPVTKQGVLNNLNLAPEGGPHGEPSTKVNLNTRIIPFSALDLLGERRSDPVMPRHYRHDAESFAWCLIYICVCMRKDDEGRIGTIKPCPLSSWFTYKSNSHYSKVSLHSTRFLNDPPLHKRAAPLATALQDYWVERHGGKSTTKCPASLEHQTRIAPAEESHMQPSDLESLKRVLELHESAIQALPEPQAELIRDTTAIVRSLYR